MKGDYILLLKSLYKTWSLGRPTEWRWRSISMLKTLQAVSRREEIDKNFMSLDSSYGSMTNSTLAITYETVDWTPAFLAQLYFLLKQTVQDLPLKKRLHRTFCFPTWMWKLSFIPKENKIKWKHFLILKHESLF